MREVLLWLIAAHSALASRSVFSVHDDVLAFPQAGLSNSNFWTPSLTHFCAQYQIVFSETYISESDAESRLAFASSSSSAKATTTVSVQYADESARGLSQVRTGGASSRDNADFESGDTTRDYEQMILDGRRYLCAIPQVDMKSKNETSENVSEADHQKELARATDRGWELLKDLEGKCMYFVSGWWSYSFCYNTQIKQFHQLPPGNGQPIYPPTEDNTTPSYVLGKFEAKDKSKPRDDKGSSKAKPTTDAAELQTKGDTRYLVQKLGGGTTCDLTGKERRVEVQFHCHPQSTDRIGWIKEVTTCTYLVVIYTPRLCNDVAFLPPREDKAHPITCQEILGPDEVQEWEAWKANEASTKLVGSTNEARPVVGGVEVGAQKLVGKEGRRIEKGRVASSGEKADVVAKSEGGTIHRLSKEDLKKFNLDPETIEALKKELQEMAGTKDWKLEIVDAPGGVRELRGIVEGDAAENEEEEKKGEEKSGDEVEKDGEVEGSEEVYKEEL